MRNWSFLALALVLVLAGPAAAQHDHDHAHGEGHDHAHGHDQDPAHGHDADRAQGDMEALLAAYAEMAKPSVEHEFLSKMAGEWKAEGKFWMAPGAPPTETTGLSVNQMILGGRFLQTRYDGESPTGEGTFSGIGVDGFDRMADKYVGTWIDTFQTMIVFFEGTLDATGKVRTMLAEYPNPMGGSIKTKGVTTLISDDRFKYESFNITPAGEQKSMEILYTRR